MKKALSLFLSLCLVMSLGIFSSHAYAADKLDIIITSEKFSNALKNEFARYGIEWEMKQTDKSFIYTQAILDEELNRVRTFGEAYLKSKNQVQVEDSTSIKSSNNSPIMTAMPGSVVCSNDRHLFFKAPNELFLPGDCTVRNTATIYVDYNRGVVTGGGVPSLKVTGGTYMDDYVVLKSYSFTFNNTESPNKKSTITYHITGEFKQAYSVPGGESWALVDKTYDCTFYPFG